jgi:surfeit locus 1 family protein
MQIRFGRRLFAPSLGMTLLTVVLAVLFIILGRWQWNRGNAREAAWSQFARGTDKVVPLNAERLADLPLFQRVRVAGRFDAARQFLLDNRSYEGRAGYEVLTPLQRANGTVALVDRGWVPFSGLRDRLPGVAIHNQAEVTVTGRVADLPSAGLASGRAPPSAQGPWPKVTSFPTMAELSQAFDRPLDSHILLLDSHDPDGYVRDWHPPGLEPSRHWSYAIQWWSFAVVLAILWFRLSLRRPPR